MSDFKLYSVNWRDGMLLSQAHLAAQEEYLESRDRWYAVTGADRWGLMHGHGTDAHTALGMNLTAGSERLRVEVTRCRAMTPGGWLIDIGEAASGPLSAEVELSGEQIGVYVGIDDPVKRETGEPNPDEDPPRHPWRTSNYFVLLGEKPPLSRDRWIQVALLAAEGSEVEPVRDYYPPCLSTHADERLDKAAHDLRNRLENLLSLSSRAFVAINADGSLSAEKTSLQDAFKQTVYQFASHLSASLDTFVVGRNGRHPIEMVVFFKRLFRVFSTALNLQPVLKDFLNEKFFTREAGTEAGRFLATIDSFVMADYDHNAIGRHMREIDQILGVLRGLFGFFAQVKKEQLGAQAVASDSITYRGQSYRVASYSDVQVETLGELNYLVINLPEPRELSDITVLLNKDLFNAAQWSGMQVRLGLNEARGLGETDPVDIDTGTYDAKVALHPQDMLKSPSVRQLTLIFRGAADAERFTGLGKMDLSVYAI